jgi:DnaK suppressor protein
MNAAKRAQFKKRLLSLQTELQSQGPRKLDPNRTSEAEVGGDEDEQPLNEMMQAIASNRNKNAEGVLIRVQKALKKLGERPDEFGECEECDEEIPEGRLKAMPYAEFCVLCQSKRDPAKTTTRRKITEYS